MAILNYFKRFVDPESIMAQSGLQAGATVADFGAGNGFYPVAAAKLVGENGVIYAVDAKNEALEATMSAARHQGLKNIYTIRHDMELPNTPIDDGSCDGVVLSGILHLSHLRENVLRESYRVLKTGGRLVVIEWKKERLAFGPSIDSRIAQSELPAMLGTSGFRHQADIPADAFHYAMVFLK